MHNSARGGLLKNRTFITDDQAGNLVAFAQWQPQSNELASTNPQHGVIIPADCEYQPHLDALLKRPILAIFFEKFNDGRGYSLARILREAGFTGELRAVGDILVDQLFYLQRCGFDAFELRADQKQADALAALDTFTVTYQTAADKRRPIYTNNTINT
jgi:uncharacterized protein (DUF934 family)